IPAMVAECVGRRSQLVLAECGEQGGSAGEGPQRLESHGSSLAWDAVRFPGAGYELGWFAVRGAPRIAHIPRNRHRIARSAIRNGERVSSWRAARRRPTG